MVIDTKLRQRICSSVPRAARLVTVEPLLPLYIIGSVLTAFAAQNLYLDKACRVNIGLGDEVCDALKRRDTQNYQREDMMVQMMVANMIGWKTVIQTFVPCILIVFIGSWSDRNGRRKPCMLIPIMGELISSAGLALNVHFDRLPMEVAALTEAVFEGITGGWATMLMGSFSYIADVTSDEERTFRIGVANTFFSLGLPIAMSAGGFLIKYVGYYGVFLISVALHLIAFLYVLLWIEESPVKELVKDKPQQSFFDLTTLRDILKVCAVKGRRVTVAVLLVVVIVVVGPMHGEHSVTYLYTRRQFNWDEVDYGLYTTFATCVTAAGTLLAIVVFSKVLKIHDALIGVIGSVSKIGASFVYAFALTPLMFYFGPVAEFVHYSSFIAMRSIASKIVEPIERGRLNSLMGVIEALAPSLYAPLYTQVYAATIETFPGAFYLVGGGLKVLALLIFLWMYAMQRGISKSRESRDVDKKDTPSPQVA